MKVLHLSHTPLVGAPGRVCAALNMHPDTEARWVVLSPLAGGYDKLRFELDLVWDDDRAEVLRLIEECDILHLHNYIGLDCSDFSPVNFRALWAAGKPMVRQFHSIPELVARFSQTRVEDVLSCPIPKLVIAQYPERFYPNARVVPNVVLPAGGLPPADPGAPFRIGFAPSRFNSARTARWDTKGYPETKRMLKRVQRLARKAGIRVDVDLIEQVPHQLCLARKSRCDLIIDDLVTGSYHLNTLESLAQGQACMAYLDGRTLQAAHAVAHADDFPALNVRLENAAEVIMELAANRQLAADIGNHAKAWMARHWDAARMASHYLRAYEAVIARPGVPFMERFGASPGERWRHVGIFDAEWKARQRSWPIVLPPWAVAVRAMGGRALRKLGLRGPRQG